MQFTTLLALVAAVTASPLVERGNPGGYWEAHCNGLGMQHDTTDQAHDDFEAWAASGPIINSGSTNEYVYFRRGAEFWYACTDDHNGSNFFNDDDVNAATSAMDAACPRYTTSWAIYVDTDAFPNHNTGKLIGKDLWGNAVCQGYNGN